MRIKLGLTSIICIVSALAVIAVEADTMHPDEDSGGHQDGLVFFNPVIRGDMADPTIIRIGETYYATGTSSEWAPYYPIFSSNDLVNWEQQGHVFDRKPEWTSHSFWAPELFYHNDKVYCYYTARRKSDNVSYIGVAVSDLPLGEFRDYGPVVEHGTEAIDAFVYNDNGQLYISWKAYGLDPRPNELLASKLSDDGLRLKGDVFSLLKDEEKIGVEGQCHFKHGDYYYLMYAARGCCGFNSDYEVRVARAKKFAGPYEKYAENPLLKGGGDYTSCGHGTTVLTPDDRIFYMCHAYMKGSGRFSGRQPVLHEMFIDNDDWPKFKGGKLAKAWGEIPFAGMPQKLSRDFNDDFESSKLKVDWAWNFPYSDPRIILKDGDLHLSHTAQKEHINGTVLCLRAKTPDYDCTAQVKNKNGSFKGLTVYGDDGNLVAFGMKDNALILKCIENGEDKILQRIVCDMEQPHLKMEIRQGSLLKFYYSGNERDWVSVLDSSLETDYAVRWDRVARPGLIHSGKPESPAVFSYFSLSDK